MKQPMDAQVKEFKSLKEIQLSADNLAAWFLARKDMIPIQCVILLRDTALKIEQGYRTKRSSARTGIERRRAETERRIRRMKQREAK